MRWAFRLRKILFISFILLLEFYIPIQNNCFQKSNHNTPHSQGNSKLTPEFVNLHYKVSNISVISGWGYPNLIFRIIFRGNRSELDNTNISLKIAYESDPKDWKGIWPFNVKNVIEYNGSISADFESIYTLHQFEKIFYYFEIEFFFNNRTSVEFYYLPVRGDEYITIDAINQKCYSFDITKASRVDYGWFILVPSITLAGIFFFNRARAYINVGLEPENIRQKYLEKFYIAVLIGLITSAAIAMLIINWYSLVYYNGD